jgi:hypothetical protein
MKLRENRLAAQKQGSNHQSTNYRWIEMNIEKARELRHRLRNLITIRRLTLEQIHSCRQRNVTSVGVRRMLLRDHPLMTHNGMRSWPPAWIWRGGNNNTANPKGEIGILRDVILSNVPPYSTCFLIMEHLSAEYIGALLLDDRAFCRVVYDTLLQHRFKPIHEIGGIELSYTL